MNVPPEILFQALGDATRLAVIRRLAQSPATVSQLAAPFPMALPSFVQHLKVLEQSGWIHTSKVGRVRTCQLNPTALETSQNWLSTQRTVWERRLNQLDAFLLELHTQENEP